MNSILVLSFTDPATAHSRPAWLCTSNILSAKHSTPSTVAISYTVSGTQYPVYSSQYSVPSTEYAVHSSQYPVHSINYYSLLSTACRLHSTQCVVYSYLFIRQGLVRQYPVQRAQFTVLNTQYTVSIILISQYPVQRAQHTVSITHYSVPSTHSTQHTFTGFRFFHHRKN